LKNYSTRLVIFFQKPNKYYLFTTMFTPMTQTKTVSTRIDNNVHTLFTDYCNQQGMTMSQMLNQFVNDVVEANKDLVDSSQCSIDSDEKTNSQSKNIKDILQQSIRIIDERKQKDDLSKFLKSLENKRSSTKTLSN